MIGTLSMNICPSFDAAPQNRHPIVMFYNGEDVVDAIKSSEELIEYIKTNMCHIDLWSSSVINYVGYWTNDTLSTSDDNVTKDTLYIKDIIPFDDVSEQLIAECINGSPLDWKASIDNEINHKLDSGVVGQTIINFARHNAIKHGFNQINDNIMQKIITTVQEHLNKRK